MDLVAEGQEIRIDIHNPGGTQGSVWVGRADLESGIRGWDWRRATEIRIPGRTPRTPLDVVFKLGQDGKEEVEVQAGKWWIWVKTTDLADALEKLGVRIERGTTP